jgi:hypothetical protein
MNKGERAQANQFGDESAPFVRGSMVLVSLSSPREKFWGTILELAPAGVSLRGIELSCFEDFSKQVKAGDSVTPNAVFFPMHRVERIELDAHNGDIPSLQERFAGKTGCEFHDVLQGRTPYRHRDASGRDT